MTTFLIVLALVAVVVFLKARVRVPAGQVFVVERLGRYHRTLQPGAHFLMPLLDAVRFRHATEGTSPHEHTVNATTSDGRPVTMEFSARVKVIDPRKASYAVHDPAEYLRELVRIQVERAVQSRSWEDLRESRRELEGAVLTASREAARETGIELAEFRVTALRPSG